MAKTRAEIQRAYRQRKLAELGDAYRVKDRKRKQEAYIPVDKLTSSQLKKRRQETNTRVKRHYRKKRNKATENEKSTRAKEHLVVKLPLPVRTRKVNTAKQEIKVLKQKNAKLQTNREDEEKTSEGF